METKEIKISVPDGYEINKENSTFKCVKFKPIKKYITYKYIYNNLFTKEWGFLISENGCIEEKLFEYFVASEKNNATNRKQLEKILALNQLLNIAEYYNKVYVKLDQHYTILYDNNNNKYISVEVSPFYSFGIKPIFNRLEDVQAVIDNPNFREILDVVYKTV